LWVDDWVYIYHPDLPDTMQGKGAKVTRRALNEVWAPKGWLEGPPKVKSKKKKQEDATDG
jgi:hypothetical protein